MGKVEMQETEYVLSPTNQMVMNYKVYNLTEKDKRLWSLIAFVGGG